jgi:SAM-dependent methyltransferase
MTRVQRGEHPMKLYTELASWWPLLSPPSHYVEEADDLIPEMLAATEPAPRTVLELGCGGGSMAWHLKRHFELTLTDISAEMIAQSRAVNPECEHLLGDMRTIDLGRTFDLVFIHDAIMYLTDEASLRAALATAARHCRAGGAVVVVPDCVTETFEAKTESGGEDGPDGRGLRYLEWIRDPEPSDTHAEVTFAFLLREPEGSVRCEMDRQRFGLFPRATWLRLLAEAGFNARSRMDPWNRDVFVGTKVERSAGSAASS